MHVTALSRCVYVAEKILLSENKTNGNFFAKNIDILRTT